MAGPNLDNLRKLKQMLPGMVQGLQDKTAVGKGRPAKAALSQAPRKACKVCCAVFDFAPVTAEMLLEGGVCPKCQGRLDEGFTAFIEGDRFCFGRSARLADMAGQVIQVSDHVMDKLENEFELEWRVKPEAKPDEPKSEQS